MVGAGLGEERNSWNVRTGRCGVGTSVHKSRQKEGREGSWKWLRTWKTDSVSSDGISAPALEKLPEHKVHSALGSHLFPPIFLTWLLLYHDPWDFCNRSFS